MFEASHKLRGTSFGQDRYRRRYWALPHCGGVYLEGLESAERDHDSSDMPPTDTTEQKPCVKTELDQVNEPASCVKVEDDVKVKPDCDVKPANGLTVSVERSEESMGERKEGEKPLAIGSAFSGSQCSHDDAVNAQPVMAVKTEPVKDERHMEVEQSRLNTSANTSSTGSDRNMLATTPDTGSDRHVLATTPDTGSGSGGDKKKLCLQKPPPLIPLASILCESFDQHAHSSCNGSTFRSISSILSTPDSVLPHTDMSAMMSTSFGVSSMHPDSLMSSTPIPLTNYADSESWFSVLPRRSCDPSAPKSPLGGATTEVPASATRCRASLFTPLQRHMLPSDFLAAFQSHQSSMTPPRLVSMTPPHSEDTSSQFNNIHNATAGSSRDASVMQCVTSDASQIEAGVEAMLVRDQLQYTEAKPIPDSE